jgi:hypothetical protein
MADPNLIRLITQRAAAYGVDPRAALAVARQEGLSGAIGDQGTSFGPFQLHYGGAFPTSAPRGSPEESQAWAMSPAGINYALGGIGKVAGGLTGPAAVNAIVNRFERPADPATEAAKARAAYGEVTPLSFTQGAPTGIPPASLPSALPNFRLPSALPDFTQTILANVNKSPVALMNAIAGQATAASTRALSQPFRMPTMPSDTTQVAPATLATPASGEGFKPGDPLLMSQQTRIGGEHDTAGLPGFPAYDYFAKAGSTAIAPVTGKVIKLSGHDPSNGPVSGVHGPFGWSVYVQGDDGRIYYMTHMGSRNVHVGDSVKAGQPIGTVGDYSHWGGADHIHMGVSAPGTTL